MYTSIIGTHKYIVYFAWYEVAMIDINWKSSLQLTWFLEGDSLKFLLIS